MTSKLGPMYTLLRDRDRQPLACILGVWTYRSALRYWNILAPEVISQKALALKMDLWDENTRHWDNTAFEDCEGVYQLRKGYGY